jgi:hypothetical protein
MRIGTRRTAAILTAALALALAGCGGDDPAAESPAAATTAPAATAPASAPAPTTAPEPAPPPPPPLPRLPDDVAGFDRWTRLNADPIPPDSPQTQRVGFDAHRGTKDVYVNQPRSALASGEYPDGTIVVKSAGDGGEPTLIAIMRKIAGVDPAHGDWEFIEYKRAGAGEDFATDASLADATCWGCHATAMETDWVFTTLDPG